MSNQINELSPEIRDFLLNRNLIVSDTVSNNGLSSIAVGLGQRASIDNSSNSVQPSIDLEQSSIQYREDLVLRNCYTSFDDMVQATIIDNSFCYNQTDGGYLTQNGTLNIGGPSTEALDIITSITSQEGFGLGDGGFTPQNNINTSITGRILGGVGAINDTPLGIIGGEQLLLAIKQKLAFNTQKELFGKVNLQPFSLLRGADFINPDYSITVSSSTGGRVLDTALDLSGFELPLSKLDAGASIFEDTDLFQADSVQRNNAMIRNSGKGQILRLFEGLNQNKFKPEYESDRSDTRLGIQDALEYTKPTFNLNDATDFDTFEPVELTGDQIWASEVDLVNEDTSLIWKTKQLFNNNELNLYNSMFNRQGIQDLSRTNELTTPNGKNDNSDKWLSKGSGVLSEEFLNGGGADNVFCRTWTSKVSYDNIQALQKNKGLQGSDAFPNQFRRNEGRSVLDSNGFVKVSPYNLPDDAQEDTNYAKKFMFSIENLAWNDEIYNVPNYETGPGDPITGTKGRIMWFPPYDIKFEETTSVNWDTTEFIGRGEPIYTYNNTVRSGTLSFKIIIDHPNYLNDLNSLNSDQIIASIAAGCSEYKTFFSPSEIDQIVSETNSSIPAGRTSVANAAETQESLIFYFPNDVGSLFDGYEVTGSGLDQSAIPSEDFNSTAGTLYDNGTNKGLNDPWNDENNVLSIKEFLSENPGYKLILNSYASTAGTSDKNQELSDARLENVRRWLFENIGLNLTIEKSVSNGSTQSSSNPSSGADAPNARRERKVTAEFVYDPALDTRLTEQVEVPVEPRQTDRTMVPKVKRRFHKESDYFEKLGASTSGTDKFIYEKIQEKIKFFQPAFHSTTPEGFNSRLTFLQQCTRQGPTEVPKRASNLAFGAPPVCILRIGDFYNTKIIIESLGFKFEPLVWDLNPEGVGVQPMIANVSMSFKFIGGSSLTGPINRLQNAVSFNYFANTEVYDPRADTIVPKGNGEEGFEISGGTKNLKDYLDEDEYRDKIDKSSNEELDKDQKAQADVVNEEQSEPSDNAKTDLEILKDIAWDVDFIEVVNPNTFAFIWNASTPLSNLTKEYQYILTIKNEAGAPQQVLSGTFGPSTSDIGDNVSTTIWSQGIYGIGDQTFKLTFKGNGVYYSFTQIIDPEIV